VRDGGAVLKLTFPRRFERLSVIFYLAMGWMILAVAKPLSAALASVDLWLLVAGGRANSPDNGEGRVRVIASWQNRSSCADNVQRVASAAPASRRHHRWMLARDCNNGRIVFASGFGCWAASADPDLGVAYCDRHSGADGCDRWYQLGVSFWAFRKSVLWVHSRTRDSSG
jgi:hypothetical protein